MDLYKKTHTAVLVNCWNERLETIVIKNKPSEFKKLSDKVNKTSRKLGLHPIYGLENALAPGRSLALFLLEKGYTVKDINPSLAYDQRKSAPMMRKNDEYDAYSSYHQFFIQINGKCALYFWKTYPPPLHLAGKSIDELTAEFREISSNTRSNKAELILTCIHNDGSTFREYQESPIIRYFIVIICVKSVRERPSPKLYFV